MTNKYDDREDSVANSSDEDTILIDAGKLWRCLVHTLTRMETR